MHDPDGLARELESLSAAMKRDVAAWLAAGADPASPVAAAVADTARRQQLLYQQLRENPEIARLVFDNVDPALGQTVKAHVEAGRKLRSLVTPVESPAQLPVTEPAPARALKSHYDEAEASYGIPWHVLAAINFAESRFGRVLGPSAAGVLRSRATTSGAG